MSQTIETWKDVISIPRSRFFGLLSTDYEVIVKEKENSDKERYFVGYVKFSKGKLKPEYSVESYREKRVIGIDSNRYDLVKTWLEIIIKEHLEYQKL